MPASAAGVVLAAEPLPGVHWSDLRNVTLATGIIAVVAVVVGIIVLHALSRRSIGLQLTLISAVTVVTSLAGVGDITYLMLGDTGYRTIMMELLFIAGVAGFLVALVVGRRLTKASRSLLDSVQKTGDSGLYIPPDGALPAELAGLSEGLSAAHERLAQARARERALESSRRELVAWVSHDLRTPLAGLRAMAEALEDQVVVDPREVGAYHTQIRREVDRLAVMIDDLFELSRIHAGTLRLTRRPVALEDMVAEVLASAEPVARAQGVRLAGLRGPRHADLRGRGRVRPGPAQPGHQRDPAHPVQRHGRSHRGRARGHGPVQRGRRLRRHPARGPAARVRGRVPR